MLDAKYGEGEYPIVGRNADGEPRKGAFEVTTAGAGELLYSKLATKRHLVGTRIKVDGAVVHDDRPFEAFCAEALEPATGD